MAVCTLNVVSTPTIWAIHPSFPILSAVAVFLVALAMTTSGIGMMLAPVLGPTIGGWITLNWSWRWNFYINLPMGMLAALMISIFVHDPPYLKQQRGRGRVDYIGIIFVVLALGLFQLDAELVDFLDEHLVVPIAKRTDEPLSRIPKPCDLRFQFSVSAV